MQDTIDLGGVGFVKEGDVIESVAGGYSGALLYKVTRGNERFFLKIFQEEQSEARLKEIVSIYERLGIPSLRLIEVGRTQGVGVCYAAYGYIDGQNLKKYSEKVPSGRLREIGRTIGERLLRLKKYDGYNKNLFEIDNIDETIAETIENFRCLMAEAEGRAVILRYFDDARRVERMYEQMIKYSDAVKRGELRLIHGDIKRSNIMVNENGEFHVADIESMKISYDIMSFRHQMTWALQRGHEKEAEFVKGYFDGLYGEDVRSEGFGEQVRFAVLLNFLAEAQYRYKSGNTLGFEEYSRDCSELIERLGIL